MSRFTGPLCIEEVTPGRRWRLREPIRYEAGAEGSSKIIEVPAGFETDGATIPAALRLVLAVWGTYGRAACIHDYLYGLIRSGEYCARMGLWSYVPHAAFSFIPFSGLKRRSNLRQRRVARRYADAEFHTAMIACGTTRPLAWIIWASVRLFGGRYCRPG